MVPQLTNSRGGVGAMLACFPSLVLWTPCLLLPASGAPASPQAQDTEVAGFSCPWSLSCTDPMGSTLKALAASGARELSSPWTWWLHSGPQGKSSVSTALSLFVPNPDPCETSVEGIWPIWIQFLVEYPAKDAGQRQAALARPKRCGRVLPRRLTTPRLGRMGQGHWAVATVQRWGTECHSSPCEGGGDTGTGREMQGTSARSGQVLSGAAGAGETLPSRRHRIP